MGRGVCACRGVSVDSPSLRSSLSRHAVEWGCLQPTTRAPPSCPIKVIVGDASQAPLPTE